MAQTKFATTAISPLKRRELHEKLVDLYNNLKVRFKDFGKFQDVVTGNSRYGSKDLKDEQQPEEFAKQFLIKPLVEFLGYETVSETVLPSPSGKKKPDYTIRPASQERPIFYVEAESINTNLREDNHGVFQVDAWLISRASKTNYGIATDGFSWIIRKFDTSSIKSKDFLKVNLKPIFQKILNSASFVSQEEILDIEDTFLILDCSYISKYLASFLERIEEDKQEISKRFYNDYVKLVFGFDANGNPVKGTFLLNEITVPSSEVKNQMRVFAVVFMNRLIFIRFLEEKGLITKGFFKSLISKYKSSSIPGTFYETYLKLLFYEVFNKNSQNRISIIQTNPLYREIPYLNGGLFRPVISNETNFNISNEGVWLVIDNLLEKYSFETETGINPDILGYIFEKTINFISGTGTNQQKAKGAFYTPEKIVDFIIEESLTPVVFYKLLDGLRKSGWKEINLKSYDKLETLLNLKNIPKNPIDVKNMLASLEEIRILDPACGSGHFLTAVLSYLLRIKESLLSSIGENLDRYVLKRQIISQNLYGVDIDEDAVEIAKLRLWLSLIEEVKFTDYKHVKTLPNIDFNILTGNSLIGWLNEPLTKHPLIDLSEDQLLKDDLNTLSSIYPTQIREVIELLTRHKIEDTIVAYEKLVEIYSLESGECATKVKEVLERIGVKLNEVVNSSYIDFLHENTDISKEDMAKLNNAMKSLTSFHWGIGFGKVFHDGGFDVIVGNPPYVPIELFSEVEKTHYFKSYKSPYRKFDTSILFIERAVNLLRNGGYLGVIMPQTWQTGENYVRFREVILSESSIKYVINLPFNVFQNAYVDTGIFILQKSKKKNNKFVAYSYGKKENIKAIDDSKFQTIEQQFVENEPKKRVFTNRFVYTLLENLEKNSVPLGDITDSCQGVVVSKFKISDSKINESYKRLLTSGGGNRYYLQINETKYIDYDKVLKLYKYYSQPRIFIRRIVNRQNRLMAFYFEEPLVTKKDYNPFIITNKNYNPLYLLGLINSKLLSYVYVQSSTLALKDDFRQTTLSELRKLPIKTLSEEDTEAIIGLVGKMQSLTEQIKKMGDKTTDTILNEEARRIDSEIDKLVYKIYGITDEECKLIEETVV